MGRDRRKQLREREEKKEKHPLNPETKKSVFVILFFAVAALIILSLFNIAGTIGIWINNGISLLFGIDRFLLPFVLILLGAGVLFPKRLRLHTWNYLGILLFFLSFNALANLLFLKPDNQELLKQTGGYIGQFFATLLPNFVGFWASLLILFALLLVSLLLTFNASLRQLLFIPSWFIRPFSFLKKPKTDSLWQEHDDVHNPDLEITEEEEHVSGEEKIAIEEMGEEKTKETFHRTSLSEEKGEQEKERVLTSSKKRRKPNLSLHLLEHRGTLPNSGDIERNKLMIGRTFEQFGISIEMAEVAVGPTVTQYSFRPAEGIKLSRIVSLQNDLALALAAHPIRIEAPIPGKSLVGIEIPNQRVATVSLRELLESKTFQKRKSQTELPLGKDVSGSVWSAPIERMPHLLVAGATGSGKSVCLNTLVTSLVYQNGPDDLKFILIDPKRVELTVYAGIPHLLVPPITKVDDTVNALKWTVREMERRLDILSSFGVRDIASYNEKVQEIMPRIVVIIDELADLMAASGHEVEATIVRIAQMARAVGIHLILATQRPSVDVITGTIKANFPSRIAFAVASQTDSRTILDVSGAEKLLGRGDMLYTSAELSKPKRLQGAFISENEISRIVEALKKEDVPDYNYAITEKQSGPTSFGSDDEQDHLFEEAVQIVLQSGKASTSFLQRRLKIGYSRAARIMDQLEEQGVIGNPDGSRAREVLIDEWPFGNKKNEQKMDLRIPALPSPQSQKETKDNENENEDGEMDVAAPFMGADENEEEEEEEEEDHQIRFLKEQEGDYLDEKKSL